MHTLIRRKMLLTLALLVVVLFPGVVLAQAGFYVTPSFSLSEVYDDNLFGASSRRETDFITRFTPGLEVGYQSTPLTLLGRYTFDIERFAEHSELDKNMARQEASADIRYLPTPLLTFSITGAYAETENPGELSVATGIEVGRVHARRVSGASALSSRFDPLMTGTAGYEFTREESRGVRTDIHSATLGLERRFTPQDTGSVGYTFRRFLFDGDETSAHLLIFGWTRAFTPFTTVTLRAGPRFSEGSVDPEGSASIRHKLDRGDVSLTYARSQTTVFGEAGVAETDSLVAALTYELLPFLEVRAGPGFFKTRLAGTDVKVYQATLEATYRIRNWLALTGSYDWSLQQGTFGVGPDESGREDEDIRRNLIMLKLTARAPFRVY